MFDWNDQELVNILWDEADESDDHIVPYPHGSQDIPLNVSGNFIKKGWKEETANGKTIEQKDPLPTSELNTVEHDNILECGQNEVFTAVRHSGDSWNNFSLPNAWKDSTDEPAKLDSVRQIFQNSSDDKDSDLVGYGWDNIGSFEDLDRIFSNGQPQFGCKSLDNANELLNPSKYIAGCPEYCTTLTTEISSLGSGAPITSQQCGKTEDTLDHDQPFASEYGDMNDLACHVSHNVPVNMNPLRHEEIKNNPFVEDKIAGDMVRKTLPGNSNLNSGNVAVLTEFSDKMNRQKNRNHIRSGKETDVRPYQDLHKAWCSSESEFLHFQSQYAGQSHTSWGINQQLKIQEPASMTYKNVNTPPFSPSGRTSMRIQDPVLPILPHLHSGLEVPPGKLTTLNKISSSPANPLIMTPQEKINKLKRRQRLRAMLAIKKQQKHFGHQTSETQESSHQNPTIGDQMQLAGRNFEFDDGRSAILTLDTHSPAEQNHSRIMSMDTDDCSLEEGILYRLQDIVDKLDIRLRLCIRDSLCRLAQSATQRQCTTNNSNTMERSGDYSEFLPKEETNTDNRIPEAETDTNPIDRTVAHLLFHRPVELSGKFETYESPAVAKLPQEKNSTNLLSMQRGVLTENYNNMENRYDVALRGPVCTDADLSKSSSCMNTSEYTSNCQAVQEDVTQVEASH